MEERPPDPDLQDGSTTRDDVMDAVVASDLTGQTPTTAPKTRSAPPRPLEKVTLSQQALLGPSSSTSHAGGLKEAASAESPLPKPPRRIGGHHGHPSLNPSGAALSGQLRHHVQTAGIPDPETARHIESSSGPQVEASQIYQRRC